MAKKPSGEPKLDRPGAGIPLLERLFTRFWFLPRAVRRMSAETVSKFFVSELKKIAEIANNLGKKELTQRVLVPSIKGLEDSSRYWSVAMTLEHVVLVSETMEKISESLSRGLVPPIRVDIARIKPKGESDVLAVLDQFKTYVQKEEQKGPLEHLHVFSQARLVHPWFGPLDARSWNTLKAFHAAIHRRQIQLIAKGLS